MSIPTRNKLNRLLQERTQGSLYFSSWLNKNGYSNQLIMKYRKSGWFSSLSRGVMYRTGNKLNSFAVLDSFNEQLKKSYHIGAHSALELYGFNHYVPMGKPLLMVAHSKEQPVPAWLRSGSFDRTLSFFSTETFSKTQLSVLNFDYTHLKISTPEQAILECILLAPKQYSFMDIYYIMEQLTTLRSEIVQTLLENTDNIKVKRVFLYMAEKTGHYWFSQLKVDKIDLGSGKQQLTERGLYVSKYKITVPQELYEYE